MLEMKGITDIDEGTLRRVDWQELIPATLLLRAFTATFKPAFLALGAILVAAFLTSFGFSPTRSQFFPCDGSSGSVEVGTGAVASPGCPLADRSPFDGWTSAPIGRGATPLFGGVKLLVGYLAALVFALAVARTAVVRLASTSRSSAFASLKFALKRFRSALLPTLAPILFAGLAWATSLGLSLAKSALPGVGGGFLAVFAPVWAALIFAFWVLAGITAIAAPLAVVAVAAENSDAFDATSRGVSYATQRPAQYGAYALFATFLSGCGWAFVWGVSAFAKTFYDGPFGLDGGWSSFWSGTLLAVPTAYLGVCAVVYSCAIYLALRRSVDGTAFDSCAADETTGKTRRLRPILRDSQGAPTFDPAEAAAGKPTDRTVDQPAAEPEKKTDANADR